MSRTRYVWQIEDIIADAWQEGYDEGREDGVSVTEKDNMFKNGYKERSFTLDDGREISVWIPSQEKNIQDFYNDCEELGFRNDY